MLTRMAQNESKPRQAGGAVLRRAEVAVVRAYYTSEIGIKQEIEYKGNSYLTEFVGVDVS